MNAMISAVSGDDPWLNAREAAHLAGPISVATFWRRVQDGTFPQPIKLGNLSRWPRSEIEAARERLKNMRSVGAAGRLANREQDDLRCTTKLSTEVKIQAVGNTSAATTPPRTND